MNFEKTWEEFQKNKEASFPLSFVLGFLSYFYLLVYYFRVFLYKLGLIKSKRLNARVISVGNITLGGTGKTPMVIYLGERLKGKSENIAILTRGYKRQDRERIEIKGKISDWKKVGDEPHMLSGKLTGVPIFVHKDRYESGKKAQAKYNNRTFILDDGFQHWSLKRDLDIVMIDCLNPFGNGELFPAGLLREPLSALKRADVFVLNQADQVANVDEIKRVLNRYNSDAMRVESSYHLDFIEDFSSHSLIDTETLRGQRIAAFSGIANSSSFEKTLDQIGTGIVRYFRFPDHFPYGEKDILKLEKDSLDSGADCMLTTEKDAVRIPKIDNLRIPLYVVGIKLKISRGEKDFLKLIGLC
ncbi:MAG: tetraacyldisaccharide 4'-kinase [Candidatus Zixiibacteriota bacterium]